ncbi:BMP family protein [Aerococcaceae bacterium DSM 111022]|nr:BMP family protein [Aerococcaceae bacterium DSM 111022]
MKKLTKALLTLSSAALIAAPLAVSAQEAEGLSAIMITDQGGIDDKSFNQSAWEGLVAWGEEHGKEQGVGGYDYLESPSDSDYITNMNTAIQGGFDVIFGVGFKIQDALTQMSEQNPDQYFAIVDGVVEADNVASLNFKDHEAAFLAGVAAASTTETNHIGFVGGVEGVVIDRFEAGFVAGAKEINPDIEISIEYVGSFADAPRGKQIAAAMYANDADIIFQAAGGSGNGVFSEARDLVTADPERNIWVIGVDRDQEEEGTFEVDGETRVITLTSTLKEIGSSIKTFLENSEADGFTAGNTVFGLAEGGVGITDGEMAEDVVSTIEDYEQQIIDGEIEVPETPAE